MTVSSSASRNQYTATAGQTVFAYTFEIVTDDDIVVLKNGVTLTKTADYTVSGVGVNSGGNVTLVVGATAGDILTLYRDMAYERLTDYTNAGDFLAADVNNDFDRLWIATQQVNEEVNRSLKAPVTDPLTIDMTLPAKADRLGKYLQFNATTGNPEAGDVSGAYVAAGLNNYNFTGNGSTVNFTLGIDPKSENNTQVYIDGVYQQKGTYSVSGTTLTFSTAPPNLSGIEVMVTEPLPSGSNSASNVTFKQAGSSTQRTVQLKLQESISAKDFGAVGNGVVDDTVALQAAIDYCTSNQRKLILQGAYKITSPLVINYANITIEGDLNGFGSVIYPYDCAAFVIDGTGKTGGWCFNVILKDFTIYANNVTNAQDYLILLKSSYWCSFENLRISGFTLQSGGLESAIKFEGTLLGCHMNRVHARAAALTASGKVFHIATSEDTTLFMTQCDPENSFQGVYIEPNARVELISPYIERCGTSILINAGTGSPTQTPQVNIYGGTIDIPSATAAGIIIKGSFSRNEIINIDGVRFSSNDHATKKNAITLDTFSWTNENKINLTNIDWSWINADSDLYHSAYIKPVNPFEENLLDIKRHTLKKTNLSSGVAVDVFKIDGMPTTSPFAPVYLRLRAWSGFNGYGRALEESVFVIHDRFDTNAFVTTKAVVASQLDHDSANYEIYTFAMSTTENTDNVTFSLTTTFNTAIVAQLPEVYFDIEVVGDGEFTVL